MDYVGPTVTCLKAYTAKSSKSDIPNGWYVKKYKCYVKTCLAKFAVASPTNKLDSSPAIVRISFFSCHAEHNPITWHDWYSYYSINCENGREWDCHKYPQAPGLPYFIRTAVDELLRVNPTIGPAHASRVIADRFNDHVLFLNPGRMTELLISQINSRVRKLRNKPRAGHTPTVPRMRYADDLWDYIQRHRINYSKLKEIGWVAQKIRGWEQLEKAAFYLKQSEVLSGLGRYEDHPHRDLIVLDSDEVPLNARWQFLKNASEKKHKTGRDPRRRTVVFSSLSLLAIAIMCDDVDWQVCATVDGTHGMSNSSYKLLTLGIYGFSDQTCSRTFHPIVYTFGEGEREIVALHGFLNLKTALRSLFGIQNVEFKHGIVSDATPVFVNSVRHAFPSTPFMTCYPHIIRKFKLGERAGNGGYAIHLQGQKKKSWMTSEAIPAIRWCSLCKTKQQKNKMWELTKEKWKKDGEFAIAAIFEKTYIEDENFANWHYTSSGHHGSVPCNNPMENHNLLIKGTRNFEGYVEVGKDMLACLTSEFVKLVFLASWKLASPRFDIPVLQYKRATGSDDFMYFQSILDEEVDIKVYRDGWLINDIKFLTEDITDSDIRKMESAMNGDIGDIEQTSKYDEGEDIRKALKLRTERFHFVQKVECLYRKEPITYFQCDCRKFYFHRHCFQSLYMQHRDKLRLLGEKLPNAVKAKSKYNKSMRIADALKEAALKLSRKKLEGRNKKGLNIPECEEKMKTLS
jgi:hypothetical protein